MSMYIVSLELGGSMDGTILFGRKATLRIDGFLSDLAGIYHQIFHRDAWLQQLIMADLASQIPKWCFHLLGIGEIIQFDDLDPVTLLLKYVRLVVNLPT